MSGLAPYFSIIMPTHQRAPLLRRALQSLRAQTFQDFETLVVDDAGSPESAAAAAEGLLECDTYIKRTGPPGPAASRNLGLDLAKGRWIIFLDDDDSFAPHHLATVHAHAERSDAPVLFTDCEVVTEDRSKPGVPELSRQAINLSQGDVNSLWIKNYIPLHCVAYRRSALRERRFDPFMASLEDWEFLLSVCERAMPEYFPGGGVFRHMDFVNVGNRRGTQATSKNTVTILDYLYAYRRRPAPTTQLKEQRQALLKHAGGIAFPRDWF